MKTNTLILLAVALYLFRRKTKPENQPAPPDVDQLPAPGAFSYTPSTFTAPRSSEIITTSQTRQAPASEKKPVVKIPGTKAPGTRSNLLTIG